MRTKTRKTKRVVKPRKTDKLSRLVKKLKKVTDAVISAVEKSSRKIAKPAKKVQKKKITRKANKRRAIKSKIKNIRGKRLIKFNPKKTEKPAVVEETKESSVPEIVKEIVAEQSNLETAIPQQEMAVSQ